MEVCMFQIAVKGHFHMRNNPREIANLAETPLCLRLGKA